MALLRFYIDKRTLATIASDANINFAHGLPTIPDAVAIRFVATLASTTAWVGGIAAYIDATNVTLYNCGRATSGVLEVSTMCFHSIIQ
jgi:hypothetical protein